MSISTCPQPSSRLLALWLFAKHQQVSGQQQELQRHCAMSAIEPRRASKATTAPPWRAASVATSTRTTPPPPGFRRWSSSCRSGTTTAPARASTCAAAGRTAWPTLASHCRCFVPWTASFPRRRASWRTSCGWRCPATTARACWTGCPTWGEAGTPSPSAPLLEAGLAQWQHFKWSLDATAHVDQRCLELVLERTGRRARSTTRNWPLTAWWACSLGIWN